VSWSADFFYQGRQGVHAPKGKKISQKEIATLELWIKMGAPWPTNTNEKSIYRGGIVGPRMPALPGDNPDLDNPILVRVRRHGAPIFIHSSSVAISLTYLFSFWWHGLLVFPW